MRIATSIVIPTLESPTLGDTLAAVEAEIAMRDDVEIIVAGRDLARFRSGHDDARYVETERPVFPGAARNHGAARARGRRLLFTDSDCLPRSGWLARMEAALDRRAPVVGGGVAFGEEGYWSRADNVALLHEYVSRRPAGFRPYLASLNFGIQRSLFERAGGFDASLRSAEDLDLTVRLARDGARLYFEPEATVTHRPRRTGVGDLWRHHFTYGVNSARVRQRHADVFLPPPFLASRAAMLVLSPAIALATTARIFLGERAVIDDWPTAPAVFLAKMAWCLSVALHD